MIIAVCELNQYPHVAWVVAFLVGYRLFQDYILSPHLMKKSVELHPLLIIFGIFAGGDIGGVSGIFLSVPLLALARLVFYEYRKHALACLEPAPILQSEQAQASEVVVEVATVLA
jgi:predicted PurR-regulated permease PerM